MPFKRSTRGEAPLLYPLLFKPVYKDYLWGGNRIPERYGREVPDGIYAESWEMADHDDGMSVIANGWMKGRTLREVLAAFPQEIMGRHVSGTRFPLLIKIIDARQKLSVQVHPDDESAEQFGGEAKTELWYLLGEDQTQVYCGLQGGVTKEQLRAAIASGACENVLRAVPVEKDSAVFVPGGAVHAIDKDCLILEIQQNSNTTYRLYDWNRTGPDGQPRELHVAKAEEIIDWENRNDPLLVPQPLPGNTQVNGWELANCGHFKFEKLMWSGTAHIPMTGESFHALFVSEGNLEIGWSTACMEVPAGTSVLIPAGLGGYTVRGEGTVLRTTVPVGDAARISDP